MCRWKNLRWYSGPADVGGAVWGAGARRWLANRPAATIFNTLSTFLQLITAGQELLSEGFAPFVQALDDHALEPGGEAGLGCSEIFRELIWNVPSLRRTG